MSDPNNTSITRDGREVPINAVDAFAEFCINDSSEWWPLASCPYEPFEVRKRYAGPGWSQKAGTVKHCGEDITYVGPNVQPGEWSRLIGPYVSDAQTARFTSQRFGPNGTVKNLSQVGKTIHRILTPTFESEYEDREWYSADKIDTRILTLESEHFLPDITRISLRLRLQFNPPGNGDTNKGVGPGVMTNTFTQYPFDYTHGGSGTALAQSQQPAMTDSNPPDHAEWLEKFKLLQDLNENA